MNKFNTEEAGGRLSLENGWGVCIKTSLSFTGLFALICFEVYQKLLWSPPSRIYLPVVQLCLLVTFLLEYGLDPGSKSLPDQLISCVIWSESLNDSEPQCPHPHKRGESSLPPTHSIDIKQEREVM